MFKGFAEKLKTKLEKYNQNSESFIFCVSDLEYSSDREQGEYKFSIHSAELRQKLGNIIVSNGGAMSSPRGVRFSELPPRLKKNGTRNYESWIKIDKKFLVELNKSNPSRIIVLPKEKIEQKFEVCPVSLLLHRLGFSKEIGAGDVWEMEKLERKERGKHIGSVLKAGDDALAEINKTLSETNIDVETTEIDWLAILPDWCSCEVKGTGNSENNSLYYAIHINYLLFKETKLHSNLPRSENRKSFCIL